jgi:ribosomal protein L20A (L18A)
MENYQDAMFYKEKSGLLEERERFNEIKKSIEMESVQAEKPRIEMSDFGLDQLALLKESIDNHKESSEPLLIAVMRGWNLDASTMTSIKQRVGVFAEKIPELKGLFFVINGDGEVSNITENSLQELTAAKSNEIPIVPIKLHQYPWTSGLNAATAILNEIAIDKDMNRDTIKVLNISYGVDLEEAELQKVSALVKEKRFVMSVRNNENLDRLPEDNDAVWEKLKHLLRNPNSADLSEVLRSMRNTFNIMRLSDIVDLGGFNPKTVAFGGMEDADFFARMILHALSSGDVRTIKEFKEALEVPVYYSDERWEKLKHIKDPSETKALENVFKDIASESSPQRNEYRIAGDIQDFRMRSK